MADTKFIKHKSGNIYLAAIQYNICVGLSEKLDLADMQDKTDIRLYEHRGNVYNAHRQDFTIMSDTEVAKLKEYDSDMRYVWHEIWPNTNKSTWVYLDSLGESIIKGIIQKESSNYNARIEDDPSDTILMSSTFDTLQDAKEYVKLHTTEYNKFIKFCEGQ